jgi:two-component system, OmpR family, phosphate regulon sensor histidine kinase PhoR
MQGVVIRSAVWLIAMTAVMLVGAWFWGWQVAAASVLGVAILMVAWQLWHVHDVLALLQRYPLPVIASATGLWGDVYHALHGLSRQYNEALQALQAQQNRLIQALEVSPDAFVLLDEAGRIAWLNAASQRLLGLDAQRDIGKKLAYLLSNANLGVLLGCTPVQASEIAPMTLEMKGRTVNVQSFPFGNRQTLLLGQDVSELERTDRVRRDFVANVSHELRTPLTVLTGYAELLQDHAVHLPAPLQEAVQHIQHHSQRMNHLTQDLLQLATLEATSEHAHDEGMTAVSVQQWFACVAQTAAPLAAKTGVVLQMPAPQDGCAVHGRLNELISALSNLLGNAIRYSPQGGTVAVTCTVSATQVQIAVNDTGCGIAAEHLPRLTERFYRVSTSRLRHLGQADAHDTTQGTVHGTGLGLAIVKHVMLRHSGELLIHSELGKGSCFTLVLPNLL